MSHNVVSSKRSVSSQKFNPSFNDNAADVVLASNEGTLFRVHNITLRTTSGLLQLFLSDRDRAKAPIDSAKPPTDSAKPPTDSAKPPIDSAKPPVDSPKPPVDSPKPPTDSPKPPEVKASDDDIDVIALPFNDMPIERVLLMISGRPTDPWSSFAELEAALEVMDYLDTPGPLSIVRVSSFAPMFIREPIRLYGLGARYGWREVTQHATELTLTLNLFPTPSLTNEDELLQIEDQLIHLPAAALYRLLKLHRRRRDNFLELLSSTETFSVGNTPHYKCSDCGQEYDNGCWREFRSRLVSEIERNPSGKTILALEREEWEESARCWEATCSKCGRPCYNKGSTLKNIEMCVEKLPKEV